MVESGLRGLRFVGLIEDIRESLNDKDVDLLDVSHIEKNSRVEEEIQKTGVSYTEFINNSMLIEACVFNLSQIGETSSKVDRTFEEALSGWCFHSNLFHIK